MDRQLLVKSADAVILKDDLTKVTTAVMISKKNDASCQAIGIDRYLYLCLLMLVASMGVIPALFGAVLQEVVDTVSILQCIKSEK